MDKINKAITFENLKYLIYITGSFLLARVTYDHNFLIFLLPFIACSLLGGRYVFISAILGGYLSLFGSTYLDLLIYTGTVIFFFACYLLARENKIKIRSSIKWITFLATLIGGSLIHLIYQGEYIITPVVGAIVSYWLSSYLVKAYFKLSIENKQYLEPEVSIVIFSIIGISLIGINVNLFEISLSLVLVRVLLMVLSQLGFSIGLIVTFILGVLIGINYNLGVEYFTLLLGGEVVLFYLKDTNKISKIFFYIGVNALFIYLLDLNYTYIYEVLAASTMFLFIPNDFIKKLATTCIGSSELLIINQKKNQKFYYNVANKMNQFSTLFSSISKRIEDNKRINKKEKYEISEELLISAQLIERFALDIKSLKDFDNNINELKIQQLLFKYGVEVMYLNITKDTLKQVKVEIGIEGNKDRIDNIILPILEKEIGLKMSVTSQFYNEIANFHKIVIKSQRAASLKYGVSQIARDYEACGDSYKIFDNGKKCVVSLSDGMGYGEGAKKESQLALDLMYGFIDIGIEVEKVVTCVNSILKNNEPKECFATLDVLVYDHFNGKASVVKSGASPSYLIKGESIEKINGSSLPVGIIDEANYNKVDFEFDKGDYFVMVSDGIGDNIEQILPLIKKGDPQNMANQIIGKSKELTLDDKSVLIAKLV